jgi:hypothetical protein
MLETSATSVKSASSLEGQPEQPGAKALLLQLDLKKEGSAR